MLLIELVIRPNHVCPLTTHGVRVGEAPDLLALSIRRQTLSGHLWLYITDPTHHKMDVVEAERLMK